MSEQFKQPNIIYFTSKAARGFAVEYALIKQAFEKLERHAWSEEYFKKDAASTTFEFVVLSKPEYDRISKILERLGELSGEQSNKALAGQMKPYSLKETLDFIAGDAKPVNTINNGDFGDGAKSWGEKKQTATPFEKYKEHDLFGALSGIRESPGFMVDKGMHPFEREPKEINGVIYAHLKGKAPVSKHYVIMKDVIYDASAERKSKVKVYHPRAPKPEFQTLTDYVASEMHKARNQEKAAPYALFTRMFTTVLTNLVNQNSSAPDVSFKTVSPDVAIAYFVKNTHTACFEIKFGPTKIGVTLLSKSILPYTFEDSCWKLLSKTINFQVTPNYFYDYDARAEYKDKGGKR